jgi:predicted kinase
MTQATLYLLCGYPGAGKTTAAKLIEKLTGATRLSSDEVRLQLFPKPTFNHQEHAALYGYLDTTCYDLLKQQKSVIYDANLNRLTHRQEKYAMAQELGVNTVLIWVKTPKELAKSRAIQNERAHLIPSGETANQMFERVAGAIEPPTPDESAIIVEGTTITQQQVKDALEQAAA